jgi:Tol biopolymer transport system component
MRFSSCFTMLLLACGARTELGTGHGPVATTCSEPAWIIFDHESGISAIRSDGSSFHVLDLGVNGFIPSVSPDGKSLLFVTGDEKTDELVLYDFASKQKRSIAKVTLTDLSSGLGKAAVSPDGKLIAYGEVPDVRIVSFDGSNDRLLVPGPYNEGCCPWSYGHPIFSGDSATVLYSTIGMLQSIRVDGTAQTLLEQDQFFPNVTIAGFVFPEPSFSPDYSKFVAQIACDVSELRIFGSGELPGDPCTAGKKLVEVGLSQAYNEASNATWGPTNLIAYDLMKDIFVIDPSGGTPQNLTAAFTTAEDSYASDPVWAPGCTEIP